MSWQAGVDDHLQVLNDHMYQELKGILLAALLGPDSHRSLRNSGMLYDAGDKLGDSRSAAGP